MSAPVPKPRTKFAANGENQHENEQNPPSTSTSPRPPENPEVVALRKSEDLDVIIPKSPSPPPVPPRPPAKPPRAAMVNHAAAQNFGSVLGELRLNLGEVTSSEPESEAPPPPAIGFVEKPEDPNTMSPPRRMAPAPPRPPPPVGWKSELGQKPMIPSHANRPLPAIPIDLEMSPPASGPSTASSSNSTAPMTHNVFPQIVENPLYLTLDNYRSISGITPSPSIPEVTAPTASPDCEELREWLTEEEEAELEAQNRPEELNLANSTVASMEEAHNNSSEENPYTPCPRRSDYSDLEFSTHADPFDDDFFNSSGGKSNGNQNLYVSPQFEKKASHDYDNVVESCAPEDVIIPTPSPIPPTDHHQYVNVPNVSRMSTDSGELNEWGLREEKGKMKIDGSTVSFVGFVNFTSSKKEKRLHLRLRNMQLSFHEDEETEESTHGPYDIKDIYLFRQIHHDGPSTSSGSSAPSSMLLHIGEKRTVVTFTPEEPSNLWMFIISEAWLSLNYNLTAALRDADELSICGSVWIKHGATGEWRSCSVGINRMTLHYMYSETRDRILHRHSMNGEELVNVDLRKVMTMRDKIDKTEFCPNVKHKRGPFSMTLHGVTLYIDSRDDATTSHWYDAIDSLLKRPATKLEILRLTGDNIPVVVDKCIRFVSAYGMKSEGIYRRNGKVTEAKTILAKLIEDPVGYYPVQENDETVYAVADVLRQFFRKLDEPLFPSTSQADLFELALESQSDALWSRYAELIEQLPTVHHATLKKLIGHLKNVSEHATENRASVENLAKVFGASLFMTDCTEGKVFSDTYNQQINTMIHLITGYDVIFQISYQEELSRQMIKDAEKKSVNAKKPSSDFIVPIHVWEKDNRPFNVIMSLASEEVIREAVAKRGFDGPIESPYAIFECIADGKLIRRLPNSQKMSKCVFQWIDWGCKDGLLLFDHDKYKFDGNDMSFFTGKVKVAEPGSKTYKSYEFKIENGTNIVAFRNEKQWKSWPVEEVLWYIGTENSRKPPNSFNCTMMLVSKDGYSPKHAGYSFSFKEEIERTRWMTALTQFTKTDSSEPLVYI